MEIPSLYKNSTVFFPQKIMPYTLNYRVFFFNEKVLPYQE